ncbi:gibberellin 2-beta-dioxygenase 8-like [Andrographis paniculata]|uniref:gibberellin 2-beta-dioxygenase 8-like n=1 Tax=Andrographis paniculata TaxID=175694 RepID=UPI0021E8019B|nr:gibberellin 2-beta-dioxygenase 8-like [Andrographis paniculata]
MVTFNFKDSSNPPLADHYVKLTTSKTNSYQETGLRLSRQESKPDESEELPLIDLSGLASADEEERAKCASKIASASTEWGFFQVVNHGVSPKLLSQMRREQVKLFNESFSWKSTCRLLNNSYRWGTPTATSPEQFSWSEAFHMPLNKVSDPACYGEELSSMREVVMEYAEAMQRVAKLVAEVLITNLGQKMEAFEEQIRCDEQTCYLRMNRYPAASGSGGSPLISQERIIHGLVPHTDSDFLTILHQDQVGGLHLIKDSKWVAVKPVQNALIVNLGDLFQAWSNDLYKSVEHRVIANPNMERFSVAYFLCPSHDSVIGSCCNHPSVYKSFTFGEYRRKVQEDSRIFGRKVGLSRFLR